MDICVTETTLVLSDNREQNASNFSDLGLLSSEEVTNQTLENTSVRGSTWIGNIEANGVDEASESPLK